MLSYTEAQLLIDIYGSEHGQIFFCTDDGKKHNIGAIIKTILIALEAAEQERDEWRESARTANTALLKVCKERDELQRLIDLQHSRTVKADKLWRHAHPEQQHKSPDLGTLVDWLLFRAKRAEAYAAKLEKAGDAMRNKWYLVYEPEGIDWDAARKEKPGA